ncbi:hypothetical protein EIP86_008452 [Pleurotus ostreatoroseus]|nr:hypothetical protein EIP86_008452 [Pleurotus ostreatoroseus]
MFKASSLVGFLLCSLLATSFAAGLDQLPLQSSAAADQDLCPQVSPLIPSKLAKLDQILDRLHNQPAFQHSAIEALGGAVRVPTESYDDLGPVGEDPRWDTFADLHVFLESTFPRVYRSLKVTKINTYGLVFHWQGSDEELMPVLMTAHQGEMILHHAALANRRQGRWIWGRGTVDDKSDLISILTSIDSMLQEGFRPTRTFVFAFGFDEEASSIEGAGHIHTYLESVYGTDSFAALLDEGSGFTNMADGILAVPCTGEKGYLDARIEVMTRGGHSSMPPPHTGIGILAAAIVALEANPHEPFLIRNGSAFPFIQCTAKYSWTIPEDIKELIEQAMTDDDALLRLAALLQQNELFASLMTTSQAVDLIRGGVKINALPERAEAVVNHRIAEHSSVKEVQYHIIHVLRPIAKAYDMTLTAFGMNAGGGSGNGGQMVVTDAWGTALEPSPSTPTADSRAWDILAGTIQSALQQSKTWGKRKVAVAPMLAVGNTDTRWYWNLTRHIFRYSHNSEYGVYGDIHTINEAISDEAFIDKIRFHTRFILNWDEAPDPFWDSTYAPWSSVA